MKDNFSTQSDLYAKYRPTYPSNLYKFILDQVKGKEAAWDCGTGNGQIARELSQHFKTVYATDISEEQLRNAPTIKNINYRVESAEESSFSKNQFDLITVGQALHWFNFEQFFREVKRVGKPGGTLAVIGYGLASINSPIDEVIEHFYNEIIGQYWDEERQYIEEEYQTFPFPFQEIDTPTFSSDFEWPLNHLLGYLRSWSAVQHYIKENGTDPVTLIESDLKEAWGQDEKRMIRFPLLLRVGVIKKYPSQK